MGTSIWKKLGLSTLIVGSVSLGTWMASVWANASLDSLGKYRNTYYYLVLEEDYPRTPLTAEVRTMRDTVLAKVHPRFKSDLDIEGSGKLVDGRVVNFAGRKARETRYRFTSSPDGDGVGQCALVPFRTVAVDPNRIPLGSLVRIEETVGMKLPDGSLHDGLWRAEDVGSAIQKDRIDLFVGTIHQAHLLEKAGIEHLQALSLTLVEEAKEGSCVTLPAHEE